MTELEKLNLSQPLTDVYTAMERDLMLAIAKQIAKDGDISATSKWRLQRLAEAGDLNETAIKIIASYTGIQSDLLTEAISGAAYSVIDKLEPAFQELARQGLISDTHIPASRSVNQAIQTFRKQAVSDLNLVNTVMRYKSKQAYVDLVNKTYDAVNAVADVPNRQELLNTLGKHTMSTVMGIESRQEAVRKCIKEFSDKGIPAFVDAAGREWSPEAYINMDIRTTVSNTANAAQDARCDDYGIDLIEVSSHPGARPKCAQDQGQVYSRSNQSGIAHDGNGKEIPYKPLSSTSYGEPDGLFGINCKHKKYPFIDGVNFQRYFPYDKEENDKRYKEIQEQRRLERKIRKTKTEADMLKEIGDTEGAKAARAKLKTQRKEYKQYCDDHDLTQRSDRLTVSNSSSGSRSNAGTSAGNAPKTSFAKAAEVNVPAPANTGKAYTGEKIIKPLDNGGGSGIIGVGSENVALEYQRYGRNKDTLVNKTYIDSGEYRKKFDNLTDNPTINRAIYDKAKEALKHRSGTEFEDMYWFDSNTGNIIAQEINSTDKRAIAYSDKTRSTVEKNTGLIALHTHPSSMPPSIADFNSCFRNNYKIGYVACHNGKIFAYTSNQMISENLYELYISEYASSGLSEYDAQLNALNKIKENHAIDFWEVL